MPYLMNSPEHPEKVSLPEVVDVLIEDVEPGTVKAYPVEARYLDIHQAATAIRTGDGRQELHGILNMLQYVP